MSKTILIADDDREIADLIEVYLQNEGYSAIKCYDGEQAIKAIENGSVDLAVIDVMMPKMNGFDLCRYIRKQYKFPIIILTAKFEFTDKINGLSIGADDYMVKPFHPLELIARVKAQIRRSEIYNARENENNDENEISYRGITMDRNTHKCIFNEEELPLTPTEFDILFILCSNPGKVISSEEIFQTVWKEKYFNGNKTVMVHIRHIRDKMHEPLGDPRYIKTVWGVGYKIE